MFRTQSKRKESLGQAGSTYLWLLVLFCLIVLIWFWWHAGKTLSRPEAEAPASKTSSSRTNLPRDSTSVRILRRDTNLPALTPRSLAKTNTAKIESLPPTGLPRTTGSVAPSPQRPATNPPTVRSAPNASRSGAASATNVPTASASTTLTERATTAVVTNVAGFPREPRDILEVQVALERLGISSGSLDGVLGSQTRSALRAYQKQLGLTPTGDWDVATRGELRLARPILTTYILTTNDLASLQPLSPSWLGKSRQSTLGYESALELVAERGHASPSLVRRFNSGLDWTNLTAGVEVQIPDACCPPFTTKAAWIEIRLAEKVLEAFDANTNLLLHFPCSIARYVEKRPVGELHVAAIAPNPNYTFNPELFPESPEARTITSRLILPPGPNNPVGIAWIGLDKPGYGMHGTPNPEQVGRTESHGCFRLANWNAELLVKYVYVGLPVRVAP